MIDVLFDQYQRYQNVTDIINSLRKTGETFNILEVGANEHQNLERFLPTDHITYLDIQLPEHLLNNPRYILGDATAMDFPDNQYDVVVALDVFEHISEKDRRQFIDELYRVSSNFFIITAPFHSASVVEAESRVNAVYRSIFGIDFIWLEEHRTNGLPKISKLVSHLESNHMRYVMLSHGAIEIWERMMNIHFMAARDSRLAGYRREMDHFYNGHLYKNDFGEPSYRKICVVSKTADLAALPIANVNLQEKHSDMGIFHRMEQTFMALASIPPAVASQTDFFQLFFDEGNGFSEESSLKVMKDDRRHFNFDLEGRNLKSLRIDPSNFRGTFKIDNIFFENENGSILKEGDYEITGNYLYEFNNNYLFIEDDPCIIINLKKEMPKLHLSFDCVSLSHEDSSSSLIDYFTELNVLRQEHEQSKVNELLQEKGQLCVIIDAVEADLKKLEMDYNTLGNELNDSTKAHDEQKKAFDELSREHNMLSHKHIELLSAYDELKKMTDQSKLQMDELKIINQELDRSLQEFRLMNSNMKKELDLIYSSRGWGYLSKIKRVFGK